MTTSYSHRRIVLTGAQIQILRPSRDPRADIPTAARAWYRGSPLTSGVSNDHILSFLLINSSYAPCHRQTQAILYEESVVYLKLEAYPYAEIRTTHIIPCELNGECGFGAPKLGLGVHSVISVTL